MGFIWILFFGGILDFIFWIGLSCRTIVYTGGRERKYPRDRFSTVFEPPPPLLLLLCRAPWCSLVRGELARFVLFARSLDSCVRARIPHGVVWCQHGVVYRGIRISCVDMCRMFYYYYYQGTGRRDEGIGTRQGWRTQGDGCSFTIRVCLHQPSVYITTLALNKRRVL